MISAPGLSIPSRRAERLWRPALSSDGLADVAPSLGVLGLMGVDMDTSGRRNGLDDTSGRAVEAELGRAS